MAPEGRPPPGRGAGIPAERRSGVEGEQLSVQARRPSGKVAFRQAFQGGGVGSVGGTHRQGETP